jgi:Family of unknown function (DUF6459)
MQANLSPPAQQAVTVRLLSVPDPAPPYDDVFAASGPAQPVAVAAPWRAGMQAAQSPGPAVTCDPAGDRPPAGWPRQFAQVLAETLAGSRSADQLRPWTTEQARRRIRQLRPVLATGQRPKVRRIMTSAPSPDVVEITAIVGFGPRTRVLALRLEQSERRSPAGPGPANPPRPATLRWLCTAIESA